MMTTTKNGDKVMEEEERKPQTTPSSMFELLDTCSNFKRTSVLRRTLFGVLVIAWDKCNSNEVAIKVSDKVEKLRRVSVHLSVSVLFY